MSNNGVGSPKHSNVLSYYALSGTQHFILNGALISARTDGPKPNRCHQRVLGVERVDAWRRSKLYLAVGHCTPATLLHQCVQQIQLNRYTAVVTAPPLVVTFLDTRGGGSKVCRLHAPRLEVTALVTPVPHKGCAHSDGCAHIAGGMIYISFY